MAAVRHRRPIRDRCLHRFLLYDGFVTRVPACHIAGEDPAQSSSKKNMFKRILIANRGEIACRVIKTARRMGIETVAVYSEADRDALHVEMADEAVLIGPPAAAESYLLIDKIVEACRKTGARGRASRLRLPVRARGVSARAGEGGHRLHRPQSGRHRRDGRQDRIQEGRRQGQGLDRAGTSRRHRGRKARGEDRRRDRLSRDDQGLRRRRRQGHADRAFEVRGRRRLQRSPRPRPNPRSATTASSSKNSSSIPATSKSRCWATSMAT